MRLHRRSLTGLLLAMPFTAGAVRSASAQGDQAGDQAFAYYQQAKIKWRQAEGKSLTIAMNKHPFTKSLLPLLPEFKSLTGSAWITLFCPRTSIIPDSRPTFRRGKGNSPYS